MSYYVDNVADEDQICNGRADKATLIAKLRAAIDDRNMSETDIQRIMEEDTELIDVSGTMHHGLHFSCIMSHLEIGRRACDYAYLSKGSDRWKLHIVELESPHAKIFNASSCNDLEFSQPFNHAFNQVKTWIVYLKSNKSTFINSIDPIRVPLTENDVDIHYKLVIGRSSEYENCHEKKQRFINNGINDNIEIMSWDSYISRVEKGTWRKKCILARNNHGFSIKNMHAIPGNMFGWVPHGNIHINATDIETLKQNGYDMDGWRQGALLRLNGTQVLDLSRGGIAAIMAKSGVVKDK